MLVEVGEYHLFLTTTRPMTVRNQLDRRNTIRYDQSLSNAGYSR